MSPRLLAALIGALLVVVAGAGGAGRAGADTRQTIWLHYDYMVAPGGKSLAPDPESIQLVVDAFAAHGIKLHIFLVAWTFLIGTWTSLQVILRNISEARLDCLLIQWVKIQEMLLAGMVTKLGQLC